MNAIINDLIMMQYFKTCTNSDSAIYHEDIHHSMKWMEEAKSTLMKLTERLDSKIHSPEFICDLIRKITSIVIDLKNLIMNASYLKQFDILICFDDMTEKQYLKKYFTRVEAHCKSLKLAYHQLINQIRLYIFDNTDIVYSLGFIAGYCKIMVGDEKLRIMTFTSSAVSKIHEMLNFPGLAEICGLVQDVFDQVRYFELHFLNTNNYLQYVEKDEDKENKEQELD